MQVKNFGQVFTPNYIVKQMLSLRKNKGSILEPSCGDGAFFNRIKDCIGIELDSTKCPKNALNIDFFDYNIDNKFDTIIGNPPYVRFQDILTETKKKLDLEIFDERTNLYMFFIKKCIEHLTDNGELIFIVPRDFLKSTSCIKLNEYIYKNGTITDLIDYGDKIIFKGFSPNCIVFRFEKNNYSRITNGKKIFTYLNGQLLFLEQEYTVPFKDLFFVKVGAVSGADKYFTHENGNEEFVCSKTRTTGETRRMFYNIPAEDLLPFKEELIKRKVKNFNESNWYLWGRDYYKSDKERIYVNNKTRIKNPFFYHECKSYDGSMLAIFPKKDCSKEEILELIEDLNEVNWDELGFVCNGRFLFSQRTLEEIYLPKNFEKYM